MSRFSRGSGELIAVVDSGPLYAVVDRSDSAHARCLEVMKRGDLRLVIPALVVAEVTYIVGRRLGSRVEAAFLAGLTRFDIDAPAGDEWTRISDLVRQYSNLQLGGTDASVIALADRLKTTTVVTLDRRHFLAVKPNHCKAFDLLP